MSDSLRLLSILLVVAGVTAFLVVPTRAQTPITTIQNGNSDTRLELNHDGGFYIPGTYKPSAPNDSIPIEGAGTRLMWYPAKAAFRAGQVSTEWDATNIGLRSTAFGTDTQADGLSSTAMGESTTASGSYSTALGLETLADGFYSVAMGNHTVAGTETSLAFGQCNSANQSSDNTLLVAGNGTGNATGCDSRSDALVLDQDGNLEVAGSFVLPDGTVLDESNDLGLSLPFSGSGEAPGANFTAAFEVTNTKDLGRSGAFINSNSDNSGTALFAETAGTGEAARVSIDNSSNSDQALVVRHRGSGELINAFIATSNATNTRFVVDNDGNVNADGTISGGGADVAESFDVEGSTRSYEAGDVLTISTESDRTVTKSQAARSTRVAGVYATKPGVLLSKSGAESRPQGQIPMGIVGVIPTKVSAENGPIERGDLLVTAETSGHAMKAQPKTIKGMKVYPQGAILGKALEAFDGPGTGLIKVMVNVK